MWVDSSVFRPEDKKKIQRILIVMKCVIKCVSVQTTV